MSDKDILQALGLNDRTIEIGLTDEYLQLAIRQVVDDYLKKIDEEKEKDKTINLLKQEYDKFADKKALLDLLFDSYVFRKIRQHLANDGFIYRCAYCKPLDVSGQYCKPYKHKHNNEDK